MKPTAQKIFAVVVIMVAIVATVSVEAAAVKRATMKLCGANLDNQIKALCKERRAAQGQAFQSEESAKTLLKANKKRAVAAMAMMTNGFKMNGIQEECCGEQCTNEEIIESC